MTPGDEEGSVGRGSQSAGTASTRLGSRKLGCPVVISKASPDIPNGLSPPRNCRTLMSSAWPPVRVYIPWTSFGQKPWEGPLPQLPRYARYGCIYSHGSAPTG